MIDKAYLAFGIACLTWYAAASLSGWEFGNPRRFRPPAPVVVSPAPGGTGYIGRSPGGQGSSHYGSSGFGGGK